MDKSKQKQQPENTSKHIMQDYISAIPYKSLIEQLKKAAGNCNYPDEQIQAAYKLLQNIIKKQLAAAEEQEKVWFEGKEEMPAIERANRLLDIPTEYELLEAMQNLPEYVEDLLQCEDILPALIKGDEEAAKAKLMRHVKYLRSGGILIRLLTTTIQADDEIITGDISGEAITRKIIDKSNPEELSAATTNIENMLNTAGTDPEIANTITGQQIIRILDNMLQTLQEHSGDKLQLFLKQQVDFLAVHRPSGLIDLLGINGKPTTESIIRELGRVRFTYDGRFGEKEKKILRAVDLWLAENNYSGAKRDLNTYAILPLTDTMRMLGMAVTPDNTRQFKARLMSKRGGILQNIKRGHIDIDNGHGTGLHAEVGTGTYSVSIPRNQIVFQVSDAYATYQNAAPLGQYHSKTLYLKGLAFIIADKLQDQYFRYGNRSRGTNNILSVKKLLEFLEDELPTYDTVSRGHWVDRIREPIEDALNQIQAAGLFKWEYCKRGLGEVTEHEIETKDYRKWAALYITYKLIPAEPYTEEQIQNRQKRLEEAKEKKMLKDAQNIVNAERIKKRERRKKKPRRAETEQATQEDPKTMQEPELGELDEIELMQELEGLEEP